MIKPNTSIFISDDVHRGLEDYMTMWHSVRQLYRLTLNTDNNVPISCQLLATSESRTDVSSKVTLHHSELHSEPLNDASKQQNQFMDTLQVYYQMSVC